MSKKFVVGLALMLVAACGDGGEKKAAKACREFSSDFCGQFADCQVEVNGVSAAQQSEFEKACLDELADGLDCGDVVDTRDSLNQCIDELAARDCDAVLDFELPSSCTDVFLVDE
jgi:hypothetical protein